MQVKNDIDSRRLPICKFWENNEYHADPSRSMWVVLSRQMDTDKRIDFLTESAGVG